MNIVMYSDNFYPELSGITDSLLLLGRTLAKRGHNILFVAPSYSEKDFAHSGKPHAELQEKNITVVRLSSFRYRHSPTGQGRIALPFLSSFFQVKKFAPDILYTNSPFGAGIEAYCTARLLRKPLIGTNHTPASEFIGYAPLQFEWFKKLLLRYFSFYYNRTLFVSAPCQSLLKEMKVYGLKKPSQKIPNPTDLEAFGPTNSDEEKRAFKKHFGLLEKVILYTGRLAKEKHIDVIIKALQKITAEFPNACLALTGHGASEHALKALAKELGLEKKVFFLGFLDEKIFPLLYKAADIFVIMSTAESQSLSLMQAQASGLPTIGANARALPEYITKESGIIVPVNNEGVLSHVVRDLLLDNARAKMLGTGGMALVKKYAPEHIADVWEKIYHRYIHKNG